MELKNSNWDDSQRLKGSPPSADMRSGGKDSISPSTLIFSAMKGLLGIYTLCIPPDVPKK